MSRYLIGLLVALPVVLAPLWLAANHLASHSASRGRPGRLWSDHVRMLLARAVLALVALVGLLNLAGTAAQVPAARAENARMAALATDLSRLGATRIYSEYWTCDRLAFLSDERILCATLDERLQPALDRYAPYRAAVRAAVAPAYVFPLGSAQAVAFAVREDRQRASGAAGLHLHLIVDGYDLYLPQATGQP